MSMNYQEQLDALASLVDDWAIKKDKRVKGEFTSVDFVTFKLNQIFTPGGWSFTILDGPTLVTIKETAAYTLLVGRLEVCFADGTEAHQDDVGIWPLIATGAREGKPLTDTAPERYETVLKAARTDCLKNAARNLGACFAPLTDLALREAKKRAAYQNSHPEEEEGTLQENISELYGPQDTPSEQESAEKPKDSPVQGPQATKLRLIADAALKENAGWTGPPTTDLVQKLAAVMNGILGGDKERHTWLKWTYGKASSKEVTGAKLQVVWDMLLPIYTADKKWLPTKTAGVQAIKAMCKQALIDAGQTETGLGKSVEELYGP